MEQDCEELYWSDVEVEEPLEAMQLPVLPIPLEANCLVEELEVELAEEVEEEVAELMVVVAA